MKSMSVCFNFSRSSKKNVYITQYGNIIYTSMSIIDQEIINNFFEIRRQKKDMPPPRIDQGFQQPQCYVLITILRWHVISDISV